MRNGGFKLARIYGIEIFIDYSWLVIFLLILWLFTYVYYPTLFPEFSNTTDLMLGFLTAILFFSSALLHELAHSVVSIKNGLNVKRITLFLFGGIAELFDEPKDAKSEFKIAVAGPATSIILAILFYLLSKVFSIYFYYMPAIALCLTLFEVNMILAIFNLLPGFPLDGGRIMRSIYWFFRKDLHAATKVASNGGKIIAFLLIILGIIQILGTGFVSGIWLILVGLFLYRAAGQSYLELLINDALREIDIEKIMRKNVVFVTPSISINELMSDYFLKYNSMSFPVIQQDDVVGLVSLKDVRKKSSEELIDTHVWDLMKSFPHNLNLSPQDKAISALKMMLMEDISFIPVKNKEGKLLGLVTLEGIADYLNEQKII